MFNLNRDKDAARKIGYRFLAQLYGRDLGPWAIGYRRDENYSGSTALRDFVTYFGAIQT